MADHALSFGAAAAAYDRYRPSYPEPAVAWAVGAKPPARVVDVGAGTGILTRILLRLGFEAAPVEPDPAMRAQLEVATPGSTVLAGRAEDLPLPDGSVDGVVAGQAYHWFDPDRAHAEVARVLRGGGTFGVLWNLRDETVPWVATLSAIIHKAGGVPESDRQPDSFGPRFGPVERTDFRHFTRHTVDSLLAMLRTRSYYLTAPGQRQRAFEAAVRDLARTYPDLAGRETFELPYRTVVYRACRR
ncbi:MAG TPA: class I SAM-dependent methyltransferase [Micromonosporaceae bacterium]